MNIEKETLFTWRKKKLIVYTGDLFYASDC